jgi:hypothetical protein
MLWLNHREAFQALDRFTGVSDPVGQSRFRMLAIKVYAMVRNGWGGVEVEEGFLDAPFFNAAEFLLSGAGFAMEEPAAVLRRIYDQPTAPPVVEEPAVAFRRIYDAEMGPLKATPLNAMFGDGRWYRHAGPLTTMFGHGD